MATKKANYEKALDRAKAQAGVKVRNSFKGTSRNAIQPLELNMIEEGEKVFFPSDYAVIEVPFGTSKGVKVLTTEGKDFWVSVLTRGAKPLDGGDYVRPKGTAVEACQNYSVMDDFFKKELVEKGQGIEFVEAETVIAKGYGDEESREVKVWTLNLVADPEAAAQS